jgi:hypothetical protein
MRRLLIVGGAAALIALPATALAHAATEPVHESDPTADDAAGSHGGVRVLLQPAATPPT